MAVFHDTDASPMDQRFAAMKGLPTPVQDEYPMLISCKSAAATFPLQILLDCLAAGYQPNAWIDAKPHCRNFKRIKNVGIGFTCTDRDHLYWVDVLLTDDTSPSDIWEYFMLHGDQPVLLQSSLSKNAIHSRHITVYFSSQRVPACLLLGPDDPIREITVWSHVCIITHKLSKFNCVTPPSLIQRTQGPRHPPCPRFFARPVHRYPPWPGSGTLSPMRQRTSHSRRAVIANYPAPLSGAIAVDATLSQAPGALEFSFPPGYNMYSVLSCPPHAEGIPPLLNITVSATPGLIPSLPLDTSSISLPDHDLPSLNTDVESTTVSSFIAAFLQDYASMDDPTRSLALVQAHPGFLSSLFDAHEPTNFETVEGKLPGHAL
ncbi:hypothetical protein DYB32_009232 [Aphanomyces invadans]|uniref:Uncharacterized protein n=1 Tax=Aphanomyces invadans TaxID=157072 RepID=A0A3R6VFI3_9STRA|nr:hypothetical protein DYB32_009232 [Aphanomyces invadans]